MRHQLRTPVALAAGAALALSLLGCTAPDSTSEAATDTDLSLAMLASPSSFDPSQVQEGNEVIYAQPLYDSLLLRAPNGTIEPWLATEWSWDDSRTALTMKLRDDVDFTDGAHFDADAAKANLLHFRDANGPHAQFLAGVTDVTVDDEYTITILNDAPNPSLENALGNMAGMMASPAKLDDGSLSTTPEGTGPYTLDSSRTVPGDTYVYVRNASYWNADALPYDTLTLKYLIDPTASYNALVSGQVDATSTQNPIDQIEGAGFSVETQLGNWGGLTIFDRDGSIVPALADARVRQAINLAFDKTAALALFGQQDLGQVTSSIFDPAGPAFTQQSQDAYEQDIEQAKSLMVEAGYADGFDLQIGTNMPGQTEAVNAYLTEALSKIGVTVTLVNQAATDAFANVLAGKYAAAFTFFNMPDPWQTIQLYAASTGTWNVFHNETPELDELIATAQTASNEDSAAAYQAVNEYLVDNAWYAPWFDIATVYAHAKSVDVQLQVGQASPSIYNYKPAE